MGEYTELSRWAQRPPGREGDDRSSDPKVGETCEDAMLPAFKMEGGAVSPGVQTASRSWNRKGNRFSSRAFRRNVALLTT